MSPHRNKELVLRFFDEVFNGRQPHRAGEFIARDAVAHTLDVKPLTVREKLEQSFMALFAAFPDCQITVQDMTAERDVVVFRGTLNGTHRGVFRGIAPTGKSFSITLIHWLRIVDDQILECWGICEDLEKALSAKS